MRLRLFLASALVLLFAPVARAGGPGILIGAAEDGALQSDAVVAQAKMDLARLAGFDAVRLTVIWTPGSTALSANQLLPLKNATAAAQLDGIRPILSVRHPGGKTTPRTAAARNEFAAFTASLARRLPGVTDFMIGNEPNLNRFWLPQFDRKGRDVAAPAYEALLARSYDALKRVSTRITVIGGVVSPRGSDDARSIRQTHSPTRFILDMGTAYRKSKRKKPIMDEFAIHAYQEKSSMAPTVKHPGTTTIAIADYDKLVRLLGKAFNGTAQRGSRLPILYGEFGVQSQIPTAKQAVYTNLATPAATDAVSEAVQGAYYRRALQLAYCQRNVAGILIFHVSDEADLDRWQSGIYYADDSPKSDFDTVKSAIEAVRTRAVRCGVGHLVTKLPARRLHPLIGLPGLGHSSTPAAHASGSIVLRPHLCSVPSSCAATIRRVHFLRR